jgi:hypothetical protein
MSCAALVLGLHLATAHVRNDLQDFNPGVYAKCDNVAVGVYNNSVGRTTVYGGHVSQWGPVEVLAGVATGYGNLRPVLVPSILVGQVRIHLLLPSSKTARGGIHFSWEFN